MKAYRLLLRGLLCFFLSCNVYALTPSDEARYTSLIKEIRCVVCQNQNIADSNAPLANDLRQKIYTMVEQQQSDNEIKNYLTARYGEFILLNPRFSKLTVILWLFPFLAISIIFLIGTKRLFRAHRNQTPLPTHHYFVSRE